ncbi:hypothetical protein PUN28_015643 [Cardiocondyla obscurior]|uniref:Uncharacterized protein n=1 Tax=Cardiocondyla obscurior TaxID=286306 RepID=A0AAW2EXP0_9HYME
MKNSIRASVNFCPYICVDNSSFRLHITRCQTVTWRLVAKSRSVIATWNSIWNRDLECLWHYYGRGLLPATRNSFLERPYRKAPGEIARLEFRRRDVSKRCAR